MDSNRHSGPETPALAWPPASSGGMVRGSMEERASDPKGAHQQLVFLQVGPYTTTSTDSTSCHQMPSFQPFIGALMDEEHSIDCNSYCCSSNLAQAREFAYFEEGSCSQRPWL